MTGTISSRESRIVDLIKSNPNITVETIAENLEVSSRTIKSVLKSMQDKGIIKRENGKRFGYWKIRGNNYVRSNVKKTCLS